MAGKKEGKKKNKNTVKCLCFSVCICSHWVMAGVKSYCILSHVRLKCGPHHLIIMSSHLLNLVQSFRHGWKHVSPWLTSHNSQNRPDEKGRRGWPVGRWWRGEGGGGGRWVGDGGGKVGGDTTNCRMTEQISRYQSHCSKVVGVLLH